MRSDFSKLVRSLLPWGKGNGGAATRQKKSARVLAIGDSHACFWSGVDVIDADSLVPGIAIHRIGPATAHNLVEPDSTVNSRAMMLDYLDQHQEAYDVFILSFGEIDCRGPLLKAAVSKGLSLEEVVNRTISRYTEFARLLIERYGKPCIYWGPMASAPDPKRSFNPDFPTIGSTLERNYLCQAMNSGLRRDALSHEKLAHVSIIDALIDRHGETVGHLLWDGCHVSKSLLPLALHRLNKALASFGFRLPAEPDAVRKMQPSPVSHEVGGDDSRWLVEKLSVKHRRIDYREFDLGSAYYLKSLKLAMTSGSDASKLKVETSLDGKNYKSIAVVLGDEGQLTALLDGNALIRFVSIAAETGAVYVANSLFVSYDLFHR